MAGSGSVLVIQSDWNDSLRDNNKSAWIYYKRRNERAEYGKVGGAVSDKTFQVLSRTERTITVKHQPSGMSSVFIAPVATFSSIHKKSVLSLGVGEGGLGVSVCTDNKLQYLGNRDRTLEGHLFDVYTCRLFPSGVVVLSGGGDMQVRVWDAVTGSCPVVLKGHTAAVLDTAIVDRGKNVISVSRDGTAKLWNCGEATCIATLFSSGSVINCCALSDVTDVLNLPTPTEDPGELEHCTSGKLLLLGCDNGGAHLVAVESREVLVSFSLGTGVLSSCWATVTLAVLGLDDGRLVLLDAVSRTTRPLSHDSASPVESLAPYYVGGEENRIGGVLVGRRDGVCQFYRTDGSSNEVSASPCQLTGPDCDPVYSIAGDRNHIYTTSRDGCVRKYRRRDLVL